MDAGGSRTYNRILTEIADVPLSASISRSSL